MRTRRLLIALAPMLGCLDQRPGITEPDTTRFAVIVSRPLAAAGFAAQRIGAPARAESAADSVVYVSLVPGTIPGGATIAITNLTTGFAQTAALSNGGLDPIAIPARTGDTLQLSATDSAGKTWVEKTAAGPVHPLVVVRTDPPTGGTDVTLNAQIIVVFSEPMDPGTISAQTIQVQLNGTAVAGSVSLLTNGLEAAFAPDAPFAPSSLYTLVVSPAVSTLAGGHLSTSVVVTFETGSATPGGLNAQSVSAGTWHTCAVTASGGVYCWGANESGELGVGFASPFISSPVRVATNLQFASVGAGYGYTCGLTTQGAAYCWGSDSSGVLGIGSPDTLPSFLPVPVAGGLTFTSLSVGPDHACGIAVDGRTFCWGNGDIGQLGSGTEATSHAPAAVYAPTAPHLGSVSATGLAHTCGVEACWGVLRYHVAALGRFVISLSSSPSPVLTTAPHDFVFEAVATGLFHTCTIDSNGWGYCWGTNSAGQLGTGDTVSVYCAACSGVSRTATGDALRFAQIASGQGEFTCGIAVGGAAYCWGVNDDGQLGSAPDTIGCPVAPPADSLIYYAAVSPGARIPCSTKPVRAAAPLTFSYLSTGTTHTCGIGLDGQLYCWGGNRYGQLGSGSTKQSSIPVRVPIQLGQPAASQVPRAARGGTQPTVPHKVGRLGRETIDRFVTAAR